MLILCLTIHFYPVLILFYLTATIVFDFIIQTIPGMFQIGNSKSRANRLVRV